MSGIDGGVRPSGRSFHVMVAVGSELYLHGGWTSDAWLDSISAMAPQSSDELWKYSVERASWELLRSQDGAPKPSARQRHAMEVVGAELYLHGGFDWRTSPPGESREQGRVWHELAQFHFQCTVSHPMGLVASEEQWG